MRKNILLAVLLCTAFCTHAQFFKKPVFSGVYVQWGYNRDWYSKSDIHFQNGSKYNFTIHGATAKDRPDFSAFKDNPIDITIPQNSFRMGVYLNPEHTHAIEINFDHAKYIMDDNKVRRVSGQLNGEPFDKDTLVTSGFVHFEHSDGANFLHINYVGQRELWHGKKKMHASTVWKGGAGVVVPRSEVTLMGEKLNNRYNIAGYIVSAEAGFRFYPLRNLFLELTAKGGFANYLNSLTIEGGTARHHFYYAEVIGLVGYDINFHKNNKKAKA